MLASALANEWLDIYRDDLVEDWEQAAALHDLWNTMLVPTILAAARPLRAAARDHEPGSGRPPPPSD